MKDYYYISTGDKSYFYTLNYSYLEPIYKHNCNHVLMFAGYERKSVYICNLSHDFDEAIQKAKILSKDVHLKIPKSPLDMNEREKIEIANKISIVSEGIMPYGKYKDTHVKDVPLGYIIWIVLNRPESDTLYLICYEYLIKNNYIEQWVSDLNEKVNSNQNTTLVIKDVFECGKYNGMEFSEVALTKKSQLKKTFIGYYSYIMNSINNIFEANTDNGTLTLSRTLLKNYISIDGMPNNFIKTALMMYINVNKINNQIINFEYVNDKQIITDVDALNAKLKNII